MCVGWVWSGRVVGERWLDGGWMEAEVRGTCPARGEYLTVSSSFAKTGNKVSRVSDRPLLSELHKPKGILFVRLKEKEGYFRSGKYEFCQNSQGFGAASI